MVVVALGEMGGMALLAMYTPLAGWMPHPKITNLFDLTILLLGHSYSRWRVSYMISLLC